MKKRKRNVFIGVFPKCNRSSLNSANSGNLMDQWSMNWVQFKDPVSHMCLAGAVVTSWSLTQEVASSSYFTVMTFFLSLNSMVTLISTARTAFSSKTSRSTLICTIYPPREVLLHILGEPHYIRQFNKVACTYLWKTREFIITCNDDVALQKWVSPVTSCYAINTDLDTLELLHYIGINWRWIVS